MEEKKNPYVYIYEPVLEERKAISAFFPLTNFLPKFFDNLDTLIKEFQKHPAHIILFNLDFKSGETAAFLEAQTSFIPKEVTLIGMSKRPKDPKLQKLKLFNLKEVFEYPLIGLKVKPHLDSLSRNVRKFYYELGMPLNVTAEFKSKVLAVGEADIVVEGDIVMNTGYKVKLHSEIMAGLVQGKLSLVVGKNTHSFCIDNYRAMTLTMLGLNNENLQSIRSEVLLWEKP